MKYTRQKDGWGTRWAYSFEEALIKGVIDRSIKKGWTYELRFVDTDLDNRPITRASDCNTLKEAKLRVEKLINLIHQAINDKETWIFKGVTLGFTDIEQMEHLRS